MLLSLYIVLAVAVITRVVTKWKTIAFEQLLKHERGKEQMSIDGYEAEYNNSNGSMNHGSGSGMQLAYSSSSSSAASSSSSAERATSAVGVTGVMTREGPGGMLSVEMRPRSPTAAAAAAAAAMRDDASADTDAHDEGIRETAGPVGSGFGTAGSGAVGVAEGVRGSSSSGSRSSSSSRWQRSGKWFVGKSADDLERLLLPLDG
jgi:hypothetical protein